MPNFPKLVPTMLHVIFQLHFYFFRLTSAWLVYTPLCRYLTGAGAPTNPTHCGFPCNSSWYPRERAPGTQGILILSANFSNNLSPTKTPLQESTDFS